MSEELGASACEDFFEKKTVANPAEIEVATPYVTVSVHTSHPLRCESIHA